MLTEELENVTQVEHPPDRMRSKGKAIVTLFPYAVWRDQGGENRMIDALLGITRVQWGRNIMAHPIVTLLGEEEFVFPNWVVTLVSPHAGWGSVSNPNAVTRWAAAALAVPYTEELCQSVVGTLLHIASNDRLQPFIPVDIWAWLKKRPSLPPICHGRLVGTLGRVVRRVRELGDVELLESYFLLVWSEWDIVYLDTGLAETRTSIREDLGGIGMGSHRKVLIERLDHVLGQLDMGSEHLTQRKPSLAGHHTQTARKQYGELKELLLEVDREALAILTRTPLGLIDTYTSLIQRMSTESHSTFICALPLPSP